MFRATVTTILILLIAMLSPRSGAHPNLSDYVQHDVTLTAGTTYADVTVRLTFFGRHAERQYVLLDLDGDGRIDGGERKSLHDLLAGSGNEALGIEADGQPLELMALHDPEIAMAGRELDGAPHQRLEITLTCFARLPETPDGPATLAIQVGLFPEHAALATFKVRDGAGIQLRASGTDHDLSRHANSKEPLILSAVLTRTTPPITTPPTGRLEGE